MNGVHSAVTTPISAMSRETVPLPWLDTLFVAMAMLTSLLPLYIGPLTGVLFLALPTVYVALRVERLSPFLASTWPILLLPAMAVLSAMWSDVPGSTVYYATQWGITIFVGMLIGSATPPKRALEGLFIAFCLHGAFTFAYGATSGQLILLGGGYRPFVGFAGSKNTTADMACLGMMTSVAMIGWSIAHRYWVRAAIALCLIGIDLLTLISARSAGANAAVSLALITMILWLMSRKFSTTARLAILALNGVAAAIVVATWSIWYTPLFEYMLKASGKSENLTGRTYLWERAQAIVDGHPWLGIGFASFWRIGSLEAEAIWRAMYVHGRTGFNFHSSIYEVLVYFGYVGLVIFSIVFGIYILMLLGRGLLQPHPLTILFSGLVIYDLVRFRFEALPLGIFSHNSLFIYAALAHGATRLPRPSYLP